MNSFSNSVSSGNSILDERQRLLQASFPQKLLPAPKLPEMGSGV